MKRAPHPLRQYLENANFKVEQTGTRLKVNSQDFEACIQLEDKPLVTIMTSYGYACLRTRANDWQQAAQWIILTSQIKEATAIANQRTKQHQQKLNNPWTPRLKLLGRRHCINGSKQRHPLQSMIHVRQQYQMRYRRNFDLQTNEEILTRCTINQRLEVQNNGRECYRISYDSNDMVVVIDNQEERHIVTILRPFEYSHLRLCPQTITRKPLNVKPSNESKREYMCQERTHNTQYGNNCISLTETVRHPVIGI